MPLCKAHIVNAVFGGAHFWTVQRKDVDNFYGSMFESDFVALRHGGCKPDEVIADRFLSKGLKPRFVVDGRLMDHYIPKGPVPSHHTPLVLAGRSGTTHVALKMRPSETKALASAKWQLQIERDLRLLAFVSLLKAAHLTLFNMLGYRYGLSPGGQFLGRLVLGEFFLANQGRPRTEVLANATPYFREFAPMVRPMHGAGAAAFKGTAADGRVFVCAQAKIPWGVIVLVRIGVFLHAVLVPVFQDDSGAALFLTFLEGPDERISAHPARYNVDRWEGHRDPMDIVWPKTGVLYPEE